MSRQALCWGILLWAVVGLVACTGQAERVSLASPRASRYQAKDYSRLLWRWTRSGRVVKQLDTALKVKATFFAPDYRAAYLARYAQMFKLPQQKRAALAAELAKSWGERYTFVFGAATHDFKWNDFHRKHSIWRVALVNDRGEQVDAQSLERVRRSPTWDVFYPYLEPFYQLYRVRFPRQLADGRPLFPAGTRKVILRFAGPLGSTDLLWQLK